MMKRELSMIVAVAENWAIGKDNQLLWHISDDLKYFKEVTTGNTMIMGRKTWESIGRPLPNRTSIVVSRSLSKLEEEGKRVLPEGVIVASSLESAIEIGRDTIEARGEGGEELFIIGGGQIYREALPITTKLYLTIVKRVIEDADTFFPQINFEEWREKSRVELEWGTRLELESNRVED